MNVLQTPGLSGPTLIGANAVRLLLVAFFLFMGTKNLLGDEQMARDFARWGYSDGFRQLTALLQIGGALLLVLPSTAFVGGVLLSGILLGALGTHMRHDPPAALVSPAVFLTLVAVVLVAHRPGILRATA